jgi:serine/threonine-protein kinase
VLGHYRVGPLLGRGHAGAVFRATDVKTDQGVALKVLAAEFPASAAEMERFGRAVRDAQAARHPNLVAPLGAGRSGPHCWLAREVIDGESAADLVGRIAAGEKPSWTRSARVAVHLARALDCLHRHRLVHGNITPRNVLVRRADHATKLADLGLGPALEGSRLWAAVREAKRAAELPYLAPEQIEPGGFVDGLADLYAVGAVAYALATGRPPVPGGTAEDVLDAVRHGRVARPGSIYRKVPGAFDVVLMRLLAPAQEDRYPSPAALLEDLEPLAHAHEIRL